MRITLRDPAPLTVVIVLPVCLVTFLAPAYEKAGLIHTLHLTGAQQAVPGMAVTFAFALLSSIGLTFFRDHAWNTWPRLRASGTSDVEILIGKLITPLVQFVAQFVLLFGVGFVFLGLPTGGSWLALVLVGATFSASLVGLGMALTATCRSIAQLDAIANVVSLVLAGLAGAIVPYSLLPGGAKTIAFADPAYWAMHGYQQVVARGAGIDRVLPTAVILAGFAVAFFVFAAARFSFEDEKNTWG